jgi:hypothetical protein
MRVWADLGEPGKAEAALMELQSRSSAHMTEQDAAASSSASLVPNSESYALVIRGWLAAAERGDKFALAQAVRWLDAVRDREDRDSGRTASVLTQVDMYGGILSAARRCASRHPDVVLEVAVSTFEKLRRSHHPVDCLHHSRLLQVGLAALGGRPGKDSRARLAEFVARIFRDCCEDGLMSKPFVLALVMGPPASRASSHQRFTDGEYRRLVADLLLPFHDASNDDDNDADDELVPFPASWTRNVRQVGLLPTRHDLEKALFVVRQQHGHDLE